MWKSRFNWASRVCSSRSVWFAKLSAIYQDPEHKSWKTFTYMSQMWTNATIRLRMKWLWYFACVSRSLLYDRVINSRWLSVLVEVVIRGGRENGERPQRRLLRWFLRWGVQFIQLSITDSVLFATLYWLSGWCGMAEPAVVTHTGPTTTASVCFKGDFQGQRYPWNDWGKETLCEAKRVSWKNRTPPLFQGLFLSLHFYTVALKKKLTAYSWTIESIWN